MCKASILGFTHKYSVYPHTAIHYYGRLYTASVSSGQKNMPTIYIECLKLPMYMRPYRCILSVLIVLDIRCDILNIYKADTFFQYWLQTECEYVNQDFRIKSLFATW